MTEQIPEPRMILEPVEPLVAHVTALVKVAGSPNIVARRSGLHHTTVNSILHGGRYYVHPRTREVLFDLLPEDFSWTPDPVVVKALEQSLVHPKHVATPYGEKLKYALHMLTEAQWSTAQVRKSLRVRPSEVDILVRRLKAKS